MKMFMINNGFDSRFVLAKNSKGLEQRYPLDSHSIQEVRINRGKAVGYADNYDPAYFYADCPECGHEVMTCQRRVICPKCGCIVRITNRAEVSEDEREIAAFMFFQ
jgi:hypothetical protein